MKVNLKQAGKALVSLEKVIRKNGTDIVRDSVIKRFEYSFDLAWKTLKSYLLENEGIDCASPKSGFREALRVGVMNEKETQEALKMTNDRNLTVHTYNESLAVHMNARVKTRYYLLLKNLVSRIAERS